MSIKDIKIKYRLSDNVKGRQAINHAVREEIMGGNYCLDALAATSELVNKYRGLRWDTTQLEIALGILSREADKMRAVVCRKYDIEDA